MVRPVELKVLCAWSSASIMKILPCALFLSLARYHSLSLSRSLAPLSLALSTCRNNLLTHYPSVTLASCWDLLRARVTTAMP